MAQVATRRYPEPLDPSYVPGVSITKLPATAPIEKILAILDRDGGVILEDFATVEELQSIENEIKESEREENGKTHTGLPIIPSETRVVPGLVGRSKTVAELCERPVLNQLREEILVDRFSVTREQVTDYYKIDPLLSISLSFQINTGAPRQSLHRDDAIHGTKHSAPFDLKKASQFACLIAGCETTRANGATMFIPGSHRWDDNRFPRVDELCFAEMKAGSALIFMGAAYHGGGHNSVPNSCRIVHGLFFVRGTLRTEENQFLAIPHSKALTMTPGMRSLLGYKKPGTALGLVENRDPNDDLEDVFMHLAT
ncbi:Dioxygenase trt7 [Talaromyces pinophilus]|nr:Dioxygenase trt7 [Talaromyces pinophilus]